MKNLTLLLLSILLLSCSSDDEELGFEKEGNFLDVYNGVVWKNYIEVDKISYWVSFSPFSITEAEYMEGNDCEILVTKWGIEDSDGDKLTIKENSNNLLIIDIISKDYPEDNNTITITTLENGNVLSISMLNGGTETFNIVKTKPCE
jgi:hypothetical protein